MTTAVPRKDQRLEFRVSAADRELFTRAASAAGVPLSSFANAELRLAAHRILADRTEFTLSAAETEWWDQLMERPARPAEGLRELLERPSPFVN